MRQDLINILKEKILDDGQEREYCKGVIWFNQNDEKTLKFLEDNNADFIRRLSWLDGSICIINNMEYTLYKVKESNRGVKCCEAIIDDRITDEDFYLYIENSLSNCRKVDFY